MEGPHDLSNSAPQLSSSPTCTSLPLKSMGLGIFCATPKEKLVLLQSIACATKRITDFQGHEFNVGAFHTDNGECVRFFVSCGPRPGPQALGIYASLTLSKLCPQHALLIGVCAENEHANLHLGDVVYFHKALNYEEGSYSLRTDHNLNLVVSEAESARLDFHGSGEVQTVPMAIASGIIDIVSSQFKNEIKVGTATLLTGSAISLDDSVLFRSRGFSASQCAVDREGAAFLEACEAARVIPLGIVKAVTPLGNFDEKDVLHVDCLETAVRAAMKLLKASASIFACERLPLCFPETPTSRSNTRQTLFKSSSDEIMDKSGVAELHSRCRRTSLATPARSLHRPAKGGSKAFRKSPRKDATVEKSTELTSKAARDARVKSSPVQNSSKLSEPQETRVVSVPLRKKSLGKVNKNKLQFIRNASSATKARTKATTHSTLLAEQLPAWSKGVVPPEIAAELEHRMQAHHQPQTQAAQQNREMAHGSGLAANAHPIKPVIVHSERPKHVTERSVADVDDGTLKALKSALNEQDHLWKRLAILLGQDIQDIDTVGTLFDVLIVTGVTVGQVQEKLAEMKRLDLAILLCEDNQFFSN